MATTPTSAEIPVVRDLNKTGNEKIEALLAVLTLKKGDEGYGNGQPVLDAIEAHATRRGSSYESIFTGRRVRGQKAARGMLVEELQAYLNGGGEAMAELEGKRTGGKATSKKDLLPHFDNLDAAAESLGYGEPFFLDRDDVPTPTGRTFKTTQPIVRVLCGDGTDRFAHIQDLHQIRDPHTGEYRSVQMIRAGRRKRPTSGGNGKTAV